MIALGTIRVLGGGLAGSEAAWQLARRGWSVQLFEMRPTTSTPAHTTDQLAELVCSNSLKSDQLQTAHGALKGELTLAGSLLLEVARRHRVPAGQALAVDRLAFGAEVTRTLEAHPRISVIRQEVRQLPDVADGLWLIATGPLTSPALTEALTRLLGQTQLHFYDALAPIVDGETIDRSHAFWATRYEKGGADYLNCPLERDEFRIFCEELAAAERVDPEPFEELRFFEACQPIEEIVRAGAEALRFGPAKPVGLLDPRTEHQGYAVIQLRRENLANTAFNLVGCQTRLTQPEQRRVFRLIPALRQASFLRYGAIHRNTYLDAPRHLAPDLSFRQAPHLFLAGQLCGSEGYMEAMATGLYAAWSIDARLRGRRLQPPPPTTALGALLRHLTLLPLHGEFSPTNVHWGLFDPLDEVLRGRGARGVRRQKLGERAVREFAAWLGGPAGPQPAPELQP